MIVSMIMLTASVFPHHHHRDLLCLQHDLTPAASDCTNTESCSHNHATDKNGCSDDNKSSQCEPCCITKFHFSEPDHSYDLMEPYCLLDSTLFSHINIYLLPLYREESYINHYTYYHEKLHSRHLAEAVGLRAPPVFIA